MFSAASRGEVRPDLVAFSSGNPQKMREVPVRPLAIPFADVGWNSVRTIGNLVAQTPIAPETRAVEEHKSATLRVFWPYTTIAWHLPCREDRADDQRLTTSDQRLTTLTNVQPQRLTTNVHWSDTIAIQRCVE
jgi:hypothetical protein